jgi:hypothetical protein
VLLTEPEIQRSIERARAAFPHFTDWECNNAVNESYGGYALWGEFVPEPEEPMASSYFITFDTYDVTWRGHLTIGKHCYYWSSADCGDANLVDTDPCATLDEAIMALKKKMANLFAALSGSAVEPGTVPDRGSLS